MTSERKKNYLEGLKALQTADTEAATIQGEPEKKPKAKPDERVVEATTEKSPPAEKGDAPAPTTSAPPAGEPEKELFPGFKNLDPETQKTISARWTAADDAEKARKEKAEAEQRWRQAQDRVGPTQQQNAKLQADLSKLQQQIQEGNSAKMDAARTVLQQRIDALRPQFAEDAEMWQGVLNEAISAKQTAAELQKKFDLIESRQAINEEIGALAQEFPTWRNYTVKFVKDDAGNQVVAAKSDHQDAVEMAVWLNALRTEDPYEYNMLAPLTYSSRAQDAIYLLKKFEHDRAQARAYASAQNGQHAIHQTETAPLTPKVNPVADPDPSRRATAPSTKTAGQPMTEKKREFLAATDLLRREGKLPPAAQPQRRRA